MSALPHARLFADGGFYDLQVIGADSTDSLAARFYYPNTVTGAAEAALQLLYWNGGAWAPVVGSGGASPAKDTTDNLDATLSGGRFSLTFDNTSTPKLTELSGRIFALGTADPTAMLAGLRSTLAGMNLDKRVARELDDHLREAQANLTSKDACEALNEFLGEAIDQAGAQKPKLTIAQAKQLVAGGYQVELALGCLARSSPKPAAAQDVLDLIQTINSLGLAKGLANDLRSSVLAAAERLVDEPAARVCRQLARLSREIVEEQGHHKLTTMQAEQLKGFGRPHQRRARLLGRNR